ncbi:MAG TPA: hypothetical protein DCE80_08005 [Ignavibacteriales bacterium]|nr:hypothetical protein [Ignavibacteriales bacterium]
MPSLPILDKNVNHSPHVVILGAGASIASYLHSGEVGDRLPDMKNLIDVLELRREINHAGFHQPTADFESFYDDLVTTGGNPQLQTTIENRVRDYFSGLRLPSQPTIYDYLVLSLRKDKDLIASFNWDPFLLDAYRRNKAVKKLPRIAFLHGNVCVAYCAKDKIPGLIGQKCQKCGDDLRPSRLLYPVKHKDYNQDPFIKNEWEVLRSYLNRAYYLTVFGYSAPKTDVEARTLMLEAWHKNPTLRLAQVEIIDIRPREDLETSWNKFFISHHYSIRGDFFKSQLMRFPRRTCDAFAEATLMLRPWHDNPFPLFETIDEMQQWINPLLNEEEEYERTRTQFSGQPLSPNSSL